MRFHFEPPASRTPGKIADAEIHFEGNDGPLSGLRLVGFAVWESREGRRRVTYPAKKYAVNGESRSFAVFRPISDAPKVAGASDRFSNAMLDAFERQWPQAAREVAP